MRQYHLIMNFKMIFHRSPHHKTIYEQIHLDRQVLLYLFSFLNCHIL